MLNKNFLMSVSSHQQMRLNILFTYNLTHWAGLNIDRKAKTIACLRVWWWQLYLVKYMKSFTRQTIKHSAVVMKSHMCMFTTALNDNLEAALTLLIWWHVNIHITHTHTYTTQDILKQRCPHPLAPHIIMTWWSPANPTDCPLGSGLTRLKHSDSDFPHVLFMQLPPQWGPIPSPHTQTPDS